VVTASFTWRLSRRCGKEFPRADGDLRVECAVGEIIGLRGRFDRGVIAELRFFRGVGRTWWAHGPGGAKERSISGAAPGLPVALAEMFAEPR